ncbi:molybdopterin-binding protein [Sporosalibacterium faouarense]|uniref:molybdopterin-binding protein n=1 Tax=Sporosalibacterium faouarense TaxID=516123 RepID=UPI00141C307A|nr:molybdopterin-binding protein [Sporosalibacterium faouarense]MTI48629.1 molybdopterin-binding protein [Bacillota bacterium]
MKKIKVDNSIGMVVAHDLTQVIPGEFKGAAFKKGHIIKKEDIDRLKDMGKNHIYVLELSENEIHENEAAKRITKAIDSGGLYYGEPSEGKISLKASYKGIVKVNVEGVNEINDIDKVILATIHNNSLVDKGQTVAGTRIIPLVTDNNRINKVEEICKDKGEIIKVQEIKNLKVGILITGTEVFEGRIKDKFGPVLEEKIDRYGGNLIGIEKAPDSLKEIESGIKEFVEKGAEIILITGGMSVDADDVTPNAIKNVADEVVTYGAPVLPGAMLMLAYKGEASILGVPACGMYHKTTVFDLIYPRLLAKEKIKRKDITILGHGGLCLNCKICHYPRCSFGK